MSQEELKQYKKLLSAAYPFEKGKIRDSVMAEIAAGSATKKNKTTLRQIALRWGSVAAAFIFICLICISIMPRLDVYVGKDSFAEADEVNVENSATESTGDAHETSHAEKSETSDAPTDAELPMEAPESYTPVEDENEYYYSENVTYSLTAITEDGAGYDLLDAVCGESTPPSSSMDDFAGEAEDENVAPESTVDTKFAMRNLMMFSAAPTYISTVTECTHSETFMNSYHEIPAVLKNLVGANEYAAWESSLSEDSCRNIGDFIEHFDISREIFTALVASTDLYYACDYPIDLLYGGDADAIEKYYSTGGDVDGCLARYFEYKFKLALGESAENYNSWRLMTGYTSVAEWSIAQLVRDMDIEREDLEAIYSSTVESFLEIYEGAKIPTYDFDVIVECGAPIRRAITSGALGHEIDAMYRN